MGEIGGPFTVRLACDGSRTGAEGGLPAACHGRTHAAANGRLELIGRGLHLYSKAPILVMREDYVDLEGDPSPGTGIGAGGSFVVLDRVVRGVQAVGGSDSLVDLELALQAGVVDAAFSGPFSAGEDLDPLG
jgi:hypothetical protein